MEKQEALQWFVDFANMKLDKLKAGDKAKLLVESEEYLSPKKDFEQIEVPDTKHVPDWFTSWIIQNPKKDTAEYWATLQALQKIVIENLSEFLMPGDEIKFGFGWEGEMMVQATWEKTLNLSFIPIARSHSEYIQLKIYLLGNGLPRRAIQKCEGCERYFFNPTFRQKQFCSPRCASRANAARRRITNPEAYRAYQRKLMRERRRDDARWQPRRTKSRSTKKGE